MSEVDGWTLETFYRQVPRTFVGPDAATSKYIIFLLICLSVLKPVISIV